MDKKPVKMNKGKAIAYARKTARLGQRYFAAPIPHSIDWLYGFGFKLGIILLLKSYLIVRNVNLSLTGFIIVLTEFLVAMALVAGGILIQQQGILSEKKSLFRVAGIYTGATVLAYFVNALRGIFSWTFFMGAEPKNPLFDFLNKVAREFKNLLMNALFMDIDLLAFFCSILTVILLAYIWTRSKRLE